MPAVSDSSRLWLDVPFAEKDDAKRLGARWDQKARSWYAPTGSDKDLARWMPLPELLPGEDREFGSGLFVDLVPSSCWFTNVRSCVSPRDWERLRFMIYRRAGYRCEACGGERDSAAGVYLEAHERWIFLAGNVQVLKRLICLCTLCHEVTHFGLARLRGRGAEALEHLVAVNDWNSHTARGHIDDAFQLWQTRSASDWTLDITMLTAVGISAAKPPTAEERRHAAAEILSSNDDLHLAAEPPPDPQVLPPAAWYEDPTGEHRWRWWDGNTWTTHVG
ncbi:DUF5710 domain-containing protein [Mycobacteroides salmoniphilum]|uniref:DNA primase TraC n=1 Tax=Mycobacteroides salmoniphilum TaxID=404941 RepID=A0A4V3HZD2_9MYCO|nr:DUF5710 domain-containing protein [Mycobacteroides salmoniphilum]TDZ93484.1 DNA primase TraC [Mycobacteroides salmoniphilum]TEA09267.1 DNA primase TraC [Mycobacteroides salmoniphilum]